MWATISAVRWMRSPAGTNQKWCAASVDSASIPAASCHTASRLVFPAQDGHGIVERGGKQEGLAIRIRQVQETPHGGEETHVCHPVRLVDHRETDILEGNRALIDEILEPPRRRNQYVDAATQTLLLRPVSDAAVHGEDASVPQSSPEG